VLQDYYNIDYRLGNRTILRLTSERSQGRKTG
jgi:hypothetical protein